MEFAFAFVLVNLMLLWLPKCCYGYQNVSLCSLSVDAPRLVNLLTWMIAIQSVWAPTMNTQAWMDGLSTALAS